MGGELERRQRALPNGHNVSNDDGGHMTKAKHKGSGFVIQRGVRVSGRTIAERESAADPKRKGKGGVEGKAPRRTRDEVLVAGDEERLQELIDDGTIDGERLQRLGAIQDASELPEGAKGRQATARKGPDRRVVRAMGGGADGGQQGFPEDYPATEAQQKALTEAGFDSPEKVAQASDEDLAGIDGIGDATIEKIRGFKA